MIFRSAAYSLGSPFFSRYVAHLFGCYQAVAVGIEFSEKGRGIERECRREFPQRELAVTVGVPNQEPAWNTFECAGRRSVFSHCCGRGACFFGNHIEHLRLFFGSGSLVGIGRYRCKLFRADIRREFVDIDRLFIIGFLFPYRARERMNQDRPVGFQNFLRGAQTARGNRVEIVRSLA